MRRHILKISLDEFLSLTISIYLTICSCCRLIYLSFTFKAIQQSFFNFKPTFNLLHLFRFSFNYFLSYKLVSWTKTNLASSLLTMYLFVSIFGLLSSLDFYCCVSTRTENPAISIVVETRGLNFRVFGFQNSFRAGILVLVETQQ